MLKLLRKNAVEYIRANIVAYFFMILIFIIGIVIGAMAVKTLPDEQKTELIGYLQVFFQGLTGQQEGISDTHSLLTSVMFNNIKMIGIMWLLGFTIVGIPFVLFLVCLRGFVIGFTVGFLVNEYIMKGLLFALVSVLPHNFLAVPAILATGVAATSFSLMLVRRKNKENLFYNSISYSVFCLIMLVLMLGATLIEVYISPVFMKTAAQIIIN
ncbi:MULTISPECIES: stage II sporulation protein M [Sporomusa]|jgi:stage II sporulation protein M|uniref:Stage II sporulation protein M n=2 Tax=Sporomusa TaxID=2375 RepID=A0ABM9VY38_9FIRM|nr:MULTISPECIES: stage II sporulation protein M [Sporomusa]MCM0760092.1 stage II sporulation protein M [Sporomusa sphaeroides DSM 2875]OLS58260.1 stage II sporulation protein M [Sporomusa sphaeroides DSM 2875]CVK17553.1 Stage II sporulation protein M [Sporomusa sphaeroides DSM 2875]SCM80357.1 Stage II sporulation protein M [uncultured Sporomusa sp.]HML31593.1 stage II sporulation protein M [Sporomusa sphaeroides]